MVLSAQKRFSLKETLEFEFEEVVGQSLIVIVKNHDSLVGIDGQTPHDNYSTFYLS